MKKNAIFLALGLASCAFQGSIMGAEVSTEPVGYNSVTALGNSDTRFSVPLHRPAAFQGAVQSVDGAVITVQGTPGWSANEFVYASGSQSNSYYISMLSGNKEGMYYTVLSNTAAVGANSATLTVDLNGDDLSGASGVVQGDKVKIIPFWTLKTLFPNQQGITGTTAAAGGVAATKIIFPDLVTPGVNRGISGMYFYYTGSGGIGPSWRRIGSGTVNKNDEVIVPDSYLIIRQDNVPTSAVLTPTGSVPMAKRKYIFSTLQAGLEQDNPFSIDVFAAMTLAQSNLYQSGAFAGTTSAAGGLGGDRLFVYDDTIAAYNKGPSAIYFYYTGTNGGGPSWRRLGGGTQNVNDAAVFAPGRGYIIRKAADAVASSVVWPITPSYVSP